MSTDFMIDINQQQTSLNTTQIIAFGDFNMNPFDIGIIKPTAFNSVSDKITAKKLRKFGKRFYERFYNPTISLAGDFIPTVGTQKVAGTYYLKSLSN